jgi:hypothetical protein
MTFLVGSCGRDFMVVGFTTICAIRLPLQKIEKK